MSLYLVSLKELLLPEGLVALAALEGLLARMGEDVGLEVTLGQGGVRTQLTLEAFLT